MEPEYDAELVERLRDRYGDAIRAVAEYDRDGYELLYIDDESAATYSMADRDDIYEDVLLEEIASEREEQLFDDMGDAQGQVRVFEDGLAAHFCLDHATGIFIAFDGSADPRIHTLRETVFGANART